MNLLLSDRPLPPSLPETAENRYISLSELKLSNCVGCFGCWVKTPGKCVIREQAVKIYPLIAQSKRLLYVSRIYCGSYDVPMKTMLERAIPVQQAFLRLYHDETHHIQRNVVEKDAVILAYGADSKAEQDLFQQLVSRNANNMSFKSWKIYFVEENELDRLILEEVQKWEAC